jgi:hypothetical protein
VVNGAILQRRKLRPTGMAVWWFDNKDVARLEFEPKSECRQPVSVAPCHMLLSIFAAVAGVSNPGDRVQWKEGTIAPFW